MASSSPTTVVVTLSGSSNVPVNADDDNGSAVTNGIPTQRDFIVAPMPNGTTDKDILPYTVCASGVPAGGTWQMFLTQTGKGKVSLWTDATKKAAFTVPQGVVGFGFSIEGTHESAAAGDISLWFAYTVNGVSYPTNTIAITVTPLINSFAVTPGKDAGDPNGQNIVFVNGINGNQGLKAVTPGGINGA